MASLRAVQSGYTSFEASLTRLFALLDEPRPSGPEWQKDLVRRIAEPVPGARPASLDEPKLRRAINGLLGFRPVAAHVYDEVDPDRAAVAVHEAETFPAGIGPALARFRAVVDPA